MSKFVLRKFRKQLHRSLQYNVNSVLYNEVFVHLLLELVADSFLKWPHLRASTFFKVKKIKKSRDRKK